MKIPVIGGKPLQESEHTNYSTTYKATAGLLDIKVVNTKGEWAHDIRLKEFGTKGNGIKRRDMLEKALNKNLQGLMNGLYLLGFRPTIQEETQQEEQPSEVKE